MRAIELTKGRVAVIDDEDFDHIAQYRWHSHSGGYASRKIKKAGKTITVYMHRQIAEMAGMKIDGCEVDHRNRDGYDNRRSNLRVANSGENKRNTGIRKDNTSGFRGVSFSKSAKSFAAKISIEGKHHHLGYFKTPEAAAQSYNEAAARLHGEFAHLNKIPQPSNN